MLYSKHPKHSRAWTTGGAKVAFSNTFPYLVPELASLKAGPHQLILLGHLILSHPMVRRRGGFKKLETSHTVPYLLLVFYSATEIIYIYFQTA